MSGQRRVQQAGPWFEEFEVGPIHEHRRRRTVTEPDVLFTTMTMNTQPLHLNARESGREAPFHDRLLNSMFTLPTLVTMAPLATPGQREAGR